jgi:hypothetical protein
MSVESTIDALNCSKMSNLQVELEVDDPFKQQLQGIVCATTDRADRPLDHTITDILRLVREDFGMDVVFVARLVNDLNVVTLADSVSEEMDIEGFSHPKAESFCQRVLDGRLPSVIPDVDLLRGTHEVPPTPVPVKSYMAAPVRLKDGSFYGMLCCASAEARSDISARDYKRLEMSARLVARLINEITGQLANEAAGPASVGPSDEDGSSRDVNLPANMRRSF